MKDIKELCVYKFGKSPMTFTFITPPQEQALVPLFCSLCVLCGLIAEEFYRAPRNNRPANAHLHRVALALK